MRVALRDIYPNVESKGLADTRLFRQNEKKRREKEMDIGLIIKVAGIGLLVSVSTQLLSKSGRDEQSMLVTLAGILVVLGLLIGKIGELFDRIMSLFGL